MLLITLAIGLVIYAMLIGTIWPQAGKDRIAERPKVWEEEWRLNPNSPERQQAAKKMSKYLEFKPPIDETIHLEGQAALEGQPRGTISLVMTRDSKVKGTWECKYEYGPIQYEIKAQVKGVTDPTNLYSQEGSVPRAELLYFITVGNYTQTSVDTKNGQEGTESGIAYIAGWLDLKYAATGEITLTTDKKGAVIYTYRAERKEE
jgi:hypothetical protein